MVPEISFGHRVRVALDIGCGVASFGAFLLQRNVTTLSIAPKDVHENQIQFALERGVPAMVVVFATHRLLYPSQAFDLIHCSRCRINWTRDGKFFFIWTYPKQLLYLELFENCLYINMKRFYKSNGKKWRILLLVYAGN
ncbi:hypothetical protein Gorai_016315 [Gossypium raimondii]|uniref:Methyltransferase n=1 Tax=Gossypium raimondii TaxID=29730 RepID=A0A7J8P9G0_GOSRA|nr:hypothetical protein [Gossypium raimondii]